MPRSKTESSRQVTEAVKVALDGLSHPDIRLTVVAVVPWIVIGLVAIALIWLQR